MSESNCRHFNGYKPCEKNKTCDGDCPQYEILQSRVLIVHLGALGAVLRSTALLTSIKRKFPKSSITWITQSPAHYLLMNNPLIDHVELFDFETVTRLKSQEFDVALCIDKSQLAAGIIQQLNVEMVLGFTTNRQGSIVPANSGATELWELGLDNYKKFFINKKSEIELTHQALELGQYFKSEYLLFMSEQETQQAQMRSIEWNKHSGPIIGLNTGCSHILPEKKLSVALHRELIEKLLYHNFKNIVLLGGREDEVRNQEIAMGFSVIKSPHQSGLRDGIASVAACDIVVSGDSLGMHIAIALKKQIVAWFGPTCAQEIELYGRGEKIVSDLSCSPCWNRNCKMQLKCNDALDLSQIIQSIQNFSLQDKPHLVDL